MPIRHSSPQARRGEALLVLFMIFFVFLSLFLGGVVWYLYMDQEDNHARTQEAENTVKAMEDDRNYYKFQALMLRDYIGNPPDAPELAARLKPPEDVTALGELRKKFDSYKGKTDNTDFGKEHAYVIEGNCPNPECKYNKEKVLFENQSKKVVTSPAAGTAAKPDQQPAKKPVSTSSLSLPTTVDFFAKLDKDQGWNETTKACTNTLYMRIQKLEGDLKQANDDAKEKQTQAEKASAAAGDMQKQLKDAAEQHLAEMKKLKDESLKEWTDLQTKHTELLKKYEKLSTENADLKVGKFVSQATREQDEIAALKKENAELRSELSRLREHMPTSPAPPATTPATPPSTTPASAPLGAGVAAILSNKCVACHMAPRSPKGVLIVLANGTINPALDRQRVLASIEAGRMPKNPITNAPERLQPNELALLRQELGAQPSPPRAGGPTIGPLPGNPIVNLPGNPGGALPGNPGPALPANPGLPLPGNPGALPGNPGAGPGANPGLPLPGNPGAGPGANPGLPLPGNPGAVPGANPGLPLPGAPGAVPGNPGLPPPTLPGAGPAANPGLPPPTLPGAAPPANPAVPAPANGGATLPGNPGATPPGAPPAPPGANPAVPIGGNPAGPPPANPALPGGAGNPIVPAAGNPGALPGIPAPGVPPARPPF